MDEPGGLGGVTVRLGARVQALWMAFRGLPAPAQIASVAASGLLVGAVLLAVAIWPFGSSPATHAVAGGSDALNSALTPTVTASAGASGSGPWTGGGPAGASGNPSTSATPQSGTPGALTAVITQVAVHVTGAELSVQTAPGASATAAVTYTSAQIPDTSSGLSGTRTANSRGTSTWTWTPIGAIPGQGGEACVSVQLGDQSTGACQTFTTTTGPLPTLIPSPLPDPAPSVPPLPTFTIPTVTLPTVTIPTVTVSVPSILPTTTITIPILKEIRPAAPHEDL